MATYYGCKDIVELLIKNGANVNIEDENGRVLLDIAKKLGRKDIIDLLSEAQSKQNLVAKVTKTGEDAQYSHGPSASML